MRGKVEVTEFTEAGAEWPISALLLIQKNEKKLEQEHTLLKESSLGGLYKMFIAHLRTYIHP